MGILITDLPSETLVEIFLFLSFRDIFACRAAHSTFNRLAQDHPAIAYHVLQEVNDVEDNAGVALSVTEKLQHLESVQHGWMHAETSFDKVIPTEHVRSGLYDFTGGLYFSGNSQRTALYYYKLPMQPEENTGWKFIQVEPGRTIIDFGVSAYEHDLIVILTQRSSSTAPDTWILEAHLIQLSTHLPHPLAGEPDIIIQEIDWHDFCADIEIVGENLFVIIHPTSDSNLPDKLFVYNWKTGKLKMSIEAPNESLGGLCPLSENEFLIPNDPKRVLDLWRVSDDIDTQPSKPERSLGLPALDSYRFLHSAVCRGEPNPAGKLSFSTAPYDSKSDNALVIVTFYTYLGQHVLVTKRHLLLALFPDKARMETETGSYMVHPEPTDSHGGTPKMIDWNHWGPSSCRILRLDSAQFMWSTISSGQRLINRKPGTDEDSRVLEIYDFNVQRIKITEAYLKKHNVPNMEVVWGQTPTPGLPGFGDNNAPDAYRLDTGLPYSKVVSKFPMMDVALMDEHHILGVKGYVADSNEYGDQRSIHVFCMGRAA